MDVDSTDHSFTTSFDLDATVCACGRTFTQSGPLKYHQRSCPTYKKRSSGALSAAKEVWKSRKKRRPENFKLAEAVLSEPGQTRVPQALTQPGEMIPVSSVQVYHWHIFNQTKMAVVTLQAKSQRHFARGEGRMQLDLEITTSQKSAVSRAVVVVCHCSHLIIA